VRDLDAVYARLRAILEPYGAKLEIKADTDAELYLDTRHRMKNGKPLFFGSVQVKKRYVSYHLMPVYTDPNLLDGTSEELKSRMQGKSCFNFTQVDDALVAELAALTEAGFVRYREAGFL
jgi:hypothetical protein